MALSKRFETRGSKPVAREPRSGDILRCERKPLKHVHSNERSAQWKSRGVLRGAAIGAP